MKQYLDLLDNILSNGVKKSSGRENMPDVIGISGGIVKMDLTKGFPLLTTKKMFFKGIIHELLWMLRGQTNIKYLVDNGVNIWSSDAYRWYLKFHDKSAMAVNPLSMEKFIESIKDNQLEYQPYSIDQYKLGDLGKVYGKQWRDQNGVDQIADLVDSLQNRPFSRYHILDAWNKADFKDMALPPCHLLYQFIVRPLTIDERKEIWYKKYPTSDDVQNLTQQIFDVGTIPKFYLDLNMYQRSCDTFLGVPFNLASMSLLLTIFAKVTNMVPGVATWIGGDVHIYQDHIPAIKEQLTRTPKELPRLEILKDLKTLEDIENLTIDDFDLLDYNPEPAIKAELFTGIKK